MRQHVLGIGWLGAVLLTVGFVTVPPAALVTGLIESHCVVEVIAETVEGEFITSDPRCFPTFGEAMQFASGGVTQLRDSASGTIVFDDEAVAKAVSSFTLGIHFDGSNGTGSSISVVGSNCSGGWWNTSTSWDNRISSSFNGCYRLRHYDLPNKAGSYAETIGAGSTHNLPSWMNNRTESVAYYGW